MAAESAGVDQLWSLGDMIGGGPDPQHVVRRTRERCAVALVGNHDYGATGSVDPLRFGEPGSAAVRSIELAGERLTGADIDWLRARKPAARRDGVQCWHASPRNAVHEYVGAGNAAAVCRRSPVPVADRPGEQARRIVASAGAGAARDRSRSATAASSASRRSMRAAGYLARGTGGPLFLDDRGARIYEAQARRLVWDAG